MPTCVVQLHSGRVVAGAPTRHKTARRCTGECCGLICRAGPAEPELVAAAGKVSATPAASYSEAGAPETVSWRWRRGLAGEIIRFGGPALGIPLADPLMSLVDSVAVAQVAGSDSLAALGPNSLIFSFATYIFAALSIATMSVMTELLNQNSLATASRVLTAAVGIAAGGGFLVCLVLQASGLQLLTGTGCASHLLQPAWEYMRVRALAMPAALTLMIAQAGLLAQRDSVTPLLAVLLQLGANIAGDYYLVAVLKQGVAGAAWATVASQYLGVACLLLALQLKAKVKIFLGLPKLQDAFLLASTLSATTFIYLCKNISYLMVQGAATRLPALQLAAHQGCWAFWALISFAHTPLEQAALAFVPAHAAGDPRRRATVMVIMGLSLTYGLVTASVCLGALTLLQRGITPDPMLWPLMRKIAPQACLATILCSLDVAATGVLIASRKLAMLVRAMSITLAVVIAYYQGLKPSSGHNLGAVWWGLVLFFGLRMSQSMVGIARMYRSQVPTFALHSAQQNAAAKQGQLAQSNQAAPPADLPGPC